MAEIGIPRERRRTKKSSASHQTHTKEIQVFRVLKFRVFGGVFWFRSRERERERPSLFFVECPSSSHRASSPSKKKAFGVFEYIRAKNTRRALLRAILYRFSSLSLFFFFFFSGFFGCNNNTNKRSHTTSLSLLCDSMWC